MKQSDHVRAIHQRAHIIDGHFDLLEDVEIQRGYGRKKMIETEYLPRFLEGGVSTIVAALFQEDRYVPEKALRHALDQISALYAEASESPEKIMICKSMDDVLQAKAANKVGFILSMEGAEPISNDIQLLRIFYELGVRLLGLVWSRRNFVGDGSHFSPVREGRKGGITEFGVQVIEQAEELGIVIDVSHLNDEGFWDVMEFAKKPVIASHSNCRSLVPSMRNLTDDQIKAIAATNGVIGINAANEFIANDDEHATIDYLLHHVDHIAKLVGVEYISLGLDLCDDLLKYMPPEVLAMYDRKPFDVVPTHAAIPQLTYGLLERGYKEEQIELLLGKNLLRVFQEVWK